MSKEIIFSGKCSWDPNFDSVSFQADIDGIESRCLISIEALADHFGHVANDPTEAYINNQDEIHKIAESVINQNITFKGEFLIKSGYVQAFS